LAIGLPSFDRYNADTSRVGEDYQMFTNLIDLTVIHFLNQFAHHSMAFDSLVVYLVETNLLKGGIILALFWWAWFQQDGANSKRHETLFFGLIAALVATLVARTLALTLPFRVRPLQDPVLNFRPPYGVDPSTLIHWSSFPSDHAVLYFCLAASLWYVSKRLGAIAFCHALVVVSLPRLYIGIHYPTDIVCGALLGIGIASFGLNVRLGRAVARPGLNWLQHHPPSFYAFLFLFSFEVTEQFDSLRRFALLAIKLR
jgi:undecaprenyl-diphosphatase